MGMGAMRTMNPTSQNRLTCLMGGLCLALIFALMFALMWLGGAGLIALTLLSLGGALMLAVCLLADVRLLGR